MTNDEFNECLAMLYSYYPNKKFDPVLSRLYHGRFIHLSYDDFYSGVNNHIDDERYKWFPDIPELRSFMPEPKQAMMLENKGGVSGCENTRRLVDKYHPVTGSYFKTIITNTDNLEVRR
ncbi:MAG: hypothetical protein ACI9HU_000634 [Colwellia sp.]|jgi:hypothetical protein